MNSGWLGFLGSVLVLLALICILRRKLGILVFSLVLQGVALGVAAATVGVVERSAHMYVAAGLALVFKGLLVPALIGRVIRRVDAAREPHGLGTTRTAVLAAGSVLLVYAATPQLGRGVAAQLLDPALAMVLLGFLLIATRRLAVSQLVGLTIMENGVFLAGVGLTHGVPLVVELGILLDVLVGLLVMGVLVSRIHRAFSTTDVTHLRQLRG